MSPTSRPPRMDVLFCADPPYFRHLAVAAASLAEANRAADLRVHVMTFAAPDVADTMVRRTLERYRNVRLHFHRVSRAMIGAGRDYGRFSDSCLLRLLAADVLPESVSRLLYLDCDILVLDDLRPLYEMDLGGRTIAAAPDFPWDPDGSETARLEALGIDDPARYANSGVLVLDLTRWRAMNFTRPLLDFARRDDLVFPDQDAINVVLRHEIVFVDPRWNLQARMYRHGRRRFPRDWAATRAARRRPAILHYTTAEKPWLGDRFPPRRCDYIRFADRIAIPEPAPAPERALHRLDRLLCRLGIDIPGALQRAARFAGRLTLVPGR